MHLGSLDIFLDQLTDYYAHNARHTLPWRVPAAGTEFDAYKILISEVMLQQTQVNRVITKYEQFISLFPDVAALSSATLSQVIAAWSGLGYNRRAKFLHESAHRIMAEHDGQVPDSIAALKELPGIGHNTAAAVCVYAFNQRQNFIETNIRTVFIYHFFAEHEVVHDRDIMKILEECIDRVAARNEFTYREFYWALMDYGTYLKTVVGNAARRSAHYTRQSRFEGSLRQLRGKILRQLMQGPHSKTQLTAIAHDNQLLEQALSGLVADGLVLRRAGHWKLPGAA